MLDSTNCSFVACLHFDGFLNADFNIRRLIFVHPRPTISVFLKKTFAWDWDEARRLKFTQDLEMRRGLNSSLSLVQVCMRSGFQFKFV